MTTKNSRISGISKPSHFFGSNINPSEKLNKKIAAFAQPKSRLAYRTASSALNKTTIVADQSLIPAADGNDVNLEKQIKKRNLPLKNGIQTSSNVMNKTQQNGIKSIKSVASLRSQLKDNSVVPSSKIGLKIQANIGDIQSPPKSQLKRNAANYNTSHAHNKDDRVKLVSYAQRRTQYKIQTENTLSSSIDQLFTSSKLIANRSTADFKLDRSKLHEEDKADTMPDDK